MSTTDVQRESAQTYGRALHRVNARLQDETLALKDSTLLSVMLLASYESALGFSKSSMAAWTAHIRGAAKLLELRGESLLETYAGRRMAAQMMANVLVDSFLSKQQLPDIISRLMAAIRPIYSNGPYWHLSLFAQEIVNFHGAHDTAGFPPEDRMAGLVDIDERLWTYLRSMSPRWRPVSCVEFYEPHEAYGGKADVCMYQDLAHFHTVALAYRIYLNTRIVEGVGESAGPVSQDPERDRALAKDAEYAVEDCGSRLCALIPQLFDRLKGRDQRSRFKEGREEYVKSGLLAEPTGQSIINHLIESGRLKGMENIGAGKSDMLRNHVWPLYYIGAHSGIDLGRRIWAVGQLQHLGTTRGSVYAAAARQTLLAEFPTELASGA